MGSGLKWPPGPWRDQRHITFWFSQTDIILQVGGFYPDMGASDPDPDPDPLDLDPGS